MSLDITLCKGKGCYKRKKCLRHVAEPNPHYQSYFEIAPFEPKKGCKYFIPVEETKEIKEDKNENL